jgi:hypothetical protein
MACGLLMALTGSGVSLPLTGKWFSSPNKSLDPRISGAGLVGGCTGWRSHAAPEHTGILCK